MWVVVGRYKRNVNCIKLCYVILGFPDLVTCPVFAQFHFILYSARLATLYMSLRQNCGCRKYVAVACTFIQMAILRVFLTKCR
jgi:hypothetical protein